MQSVADASSLAGLADPFTGGLIISIISNIGIIISFYTVEKLGRRPTVLWSGAALATVNLAIGALSFLPPTSAFGAGLITLCAIWVFIYSLSLAPIGWLSIVEVSSPRLRAKTAAVATVLQSLSNIALVCSLLFLLSFLIDASQSHEGEFTAELCLRITLCRTCSRLNMPDGA